MFLSRVRVKRFRAGGTCGEGGQGGQAHKGERGGQGGAHTGERGSALAGKFRAPSGSSIVLARQPQGCQAGRPRLHGLG